VGGGRNLRGRTAARCIFPRSIWISGGKGLQDHAYALLAHFHRRKSGGLTVTLWRTLAEAEQSKAFIDRLGCGGGCYRDHEIVVLRDFPEDDDEGTVHDRTKGTGPC
jgi:hypothetical protein